MRTFHPGPGLRAVSSAVAATLLLATPPDPALAADTGAAVDTDPTGAHVVLRRHTTWVEVPALEDGPQPACVRRWRLAAGPFSLRRSPVAGDLHPVPMDHAPGPDYQPYHVFCGTDYVTSVWLRPQQFGLDPRDLAEQLVRDLPYPAATVGTSPAARGLTGLETWCWVEGYTTAPIADRVSELAMTVDVEATATSVSWDFGDGATAIGHDLGQAPPARSSVTHTFERRARPTFTIRAVVRLDVRWRLDGGAWQDLEPVTRTATLAYPVVESRAALVPDHP